jgi:hypothetical protein
MPLIVHRLRKLGPCSFSSSNKNLLLVVSIIWCCNAIQSQQSAPFLNYWKSRTSDSTRKSCCISAWRYLIRKHGLYPLRLVGECLNAKNFLVADEARSTSATVAVLDSGLSTRENFIHTLPGYDFVSDTLLAMDGNGRDPDPTDPLEGQIQHGQQVASIIAGKGCNDPSRHIGIASNTIINPIRVLGLGLRGHARDVAHAVIWACGGIVHGVSSQQHPADVIVMAFAGKGPCPQYLQAAMDFASKTGAILLAAAGNHADVTDNFFPANCRGVISVGSLSREGVLEPYSNSGADLAAPGDGIDCNGGAADCPISCGDMASLVGTSFSVSLVAGHVALTISSLRIRTNYFPRDHQEANRQLEFDQFDRTYVEAASYDASRIRSSAMITSSRGGNRQYSLMCAQSAFVKSIQVWYDSTSLTAFRMTCKDAGNSITNTIQYGGTCFSTVTVESQVGFSGFMIGFQQWIRYVTLLKAGAGSWEGTIGNRVQDLRDLSCPLDTYLIGYSIETGFNCDARMDGIQTICAPVACPTCNPGYYASPCTTATESTCLPCPAGTYQALAGSVFLNA